jgi:hypothetical protein
VVTGIEPELWVDGARFWVASADGATRLDPLAAHGRTGRTLLVVEDPGAVAAAAVVAGAALTSPVDHEHEWEIGRPDQPPR